MVFYTEQVQGPHKEAIQHALAAYRSEAYDQATTWGILSALYETCRRQPAPKWSAHVTRGTTHIHKMLISWFPHYANTWDSGVSRECLEARINKLPGAIPPPFDPNKPINTKGIAEASYLVYEDY